MERLDLFSLRNTFEEQGVMICFNGPFSHSVIEQLGEAVKKYLQSSDAPKDRVADVFSVFVEQAQNLKNYTAAREAEDRTDGLDTNGTLIIGRNGDRYIVSSGNVIRLADADRLRKRLEELRTLDQTELKALYKKRLREPTEEDAGAGLGLVTMARKASEPLDYSIREQADGSAFFHVTVVI